MYFDLFALNETRLDSSISDGLVNISGYDIIRKDRSRRGEVCVSISVVQLTIKPEMILFLMVSKLFV